ncbi:MAG: type I-C CRISPR-associated protein Cas8c/Csd1 [Candidatus Cryptobacteroides sp.]
MILRALHDYYKRCSDMPAFGMEEKEIGFLLVIDNKGKFLRFEDCRIDKNSAKTFLVKKHVERSSNPVANYLYDNSAYVFGYSLKDKDKNKLYFDIFKNKVKDIAELFPENPDLKAVSAFYDQSIEEIHASISKDPLWEEVTKNLSKKYSTFSFRINGDTNIIAQKKEILQLDTLNEPNKSEICLITGSRGTPVKTTTATMIAGGRATAKLVSFQVNSGYDSYGKQQGFNAPISSQAEFAYTTALNTMLGKNSHNKFIVGNRTFIFWASSNNEASLKAEESLFDMLGFSDETEDNPNAKIERVRKVFESIYSGSLQTELNDRFYILGLAPNDARIAVVYWSETLLKEFAGMIIRHFNDMEIIDTRKKKYPYMSIRNILSAVTMKDKQSDVTPNLPEAVVKSIFQGLPYPYTLFTSCIKRIRAEQSVITPYGSPCRVAILKAYLNRLNDNYNKKIQIMLDKDNTNPGYLCGRLFAVLDKIQEDANKINSIRDRYMNSASSTPSVVFSTILNLSSHHAAKLSEGSKIFYEKIKQEIISKLSSDGFPTHLNLQDQSRFFVGYYHQRQDFFTKAE